MANLFVIGYLVFSAVVVVSGIARDNTKKSR